MAEKKKPSQAERAAASSKKNKPAKKTATAVNKDAVHIPVRLIGSCVCLCLLVFSIIMLFQVDGILPNFCYGVIVGLIGHTGFYFSIPALLYLFCILAFSGKRPVRMRSICTVVFVLLAGCIAHMTVYSPDLGKGLAIISDLYKGAADGSTGGVLCGLVAFCMAKILSVPGAYAVLIIAALLSLMAAAALTAYGVRRRRA